MKHYDVIHEHGEGTTINSCDSYETAEQVLWALKMLAAQEHRIDVDLALDTETLDSLLAGKGESFSIERAAS